MGVTRKGSLILLLDTKVSLKLQTVNRQCIATVQVGGGDSPGVLKFRQSVMQVPAPKQEHAVEIVVLRIGGAVGDVTCDYRTNHGTAVGESNRGTLEYGKARRVINKYPKVIFQKETN